MDFHTLMNIASAKQETKDKIKISRYNLELPPAKKEVKDTTRSDVVKKLIREKENEKNLKEKSRIEKERAEEHERKKKAQFRIPKKREPEETKAIDTEKLINSLFEDTEEDVPLTNGHDTSNDGSVSRLLQTGSEQKSRDGGALNHVSSSSHSKGETNKQSSSSSSSSHSKDKSSSSREKERSSREKHKSSHDSSKSSQSLSGDKASHSSSHSSSKSSSSKHGSKSSSSKSNSHSSSSSSKSHSSSSANDKSSSSSSSVNHKSSSSSSSVNHKSSSSSSSVNHKSSLSSSSVNDKSSSSSTSKSSSLKSSNVQQPTSSTDQPITLAKHHLKPVAERHVDSTQMTEKERILARLQAIKERTKAAIDKEQEGKRKRTKGDKIQRKSKDGDKEDERVKSKEIIKDVYSSDEETVDNSIPSALDIMLSDHKSKLEKDKISRLAKQAWERATKKDDDDLISIEKIKKKKHRISGLLKHKSERKSSDQHRKRKEHSLSPDPRDDNKKRMKFNEDQPKKNKIVRHAGKAAPPPTDFQAILAMAAQKAKEPSKPLAIIPKKKKKKEEEERPLTQEEKERKERIKTKEYQNWLKYGGKRPNDGKKNSSDEDDKDFTKVKDKDIPSKHFRKELSQSLAYNGKKTTSVNDKGDARKKLEAGFGVKPKQITVNENVLVCGAPEDGDDSDEEQNRPPSNPFDQIMRNVHKKKSTQSAPKKMIVEDEYLESEDSDMDEFIDDGDDEEENYSKHISKIFGYNKKKYVDEADDLSDMEANFATVMMEEKRSAKIGMMEDLEDMRREEEELKRKAMMKKKMRR